MIGGLIFYSYKMLKPSIEEMKQHGLVNEKINMKQFSWAIILLTIVMLVGLLSCKKKEVLPYRLQLTTTCNGSTHVVVFTTVTEQELKESIKQANSNCTYSYKRI
jgi:hypothetical protein